MPTADEFVISRSSVQSGSPAPFKSTTYRRSVGTSISIAVGILVLFLPQEARADGKGIAIPASVFVAVQGLDVHSTWQARSAGAVEGNPVMNVSTGQQIAIKAATSAGVVFIASKISQRHPTAAKVFLYGMSAVVGTVAAHNYGIAHR